LQHFYSSSEDGMSDDRQFKAKRGFPPAGEPTPAALPPAGEAAAPPAPAALPPAAAVEALPAPVRREVESGADKVFSAYWAAIASFSQSQRAVASDIAEMALEIGGLARGNMTAAGDSVAALCKARSMTDAVEIQLGFARRSLDALAAGSTRLGEIGLRLASDAAKPVLGRFVAG
jgi:hypothetical protein